MKARLLGSAAAIVLMAATSASAQETPGDPQAPPDGEPAGAQGADRETIVVTATRREESIQDVPLSVNAFDQRELSVKGVVGYEGLAAETPGVIINKPTANFNNFTARGVATNGYNANLQSTVAIYIDEVPISANGNSTIIDPNLFDVERVEFLRGPQGTLFGSGSLAGAVRILTKDPDLDRRDYSALVDFGAIGEDAAFRQRYNGMVNMPLIEDKLALRLVGFYRRDGGWIDNPGTGEENSNVLEGYGGRAVLLARPTDRFSARLLYSREESLPQDSATISPELGRVHISDRPDLFQGYLTNYNATLSYDLDFAALTSSSTYTLYDQKFYVDLAATFDQAIPFALDADAYDDIFTQEVRLASTGAGRVDWIVGGFYFTKRRDVDLNYRSRQEYLDAQGLTGLPDEYYARLYNYARQNEIAGFGELTYHVNDRLRLIGGLRYGTTDAQGFAESGGYNSNYLLAALTNATGALTVTPVAPAEGEKAEETGPSYKASVSFDATDDIVTYATYATGFRAPIANARAGAVSPLDPDDIVIPDGAGSDDLASYEVGMKGLWMDGRVGLNLAAYYIDWSNIQVQANRVSDSVQFATNIGQAISKGIEFELHAEPFEGLTIGGNGAFNEAKVEQLTAEEAAISGAVEGARLASPEFQGAAYIRYDRTLGADLNGFATVSYVYVDSFPGLFPNVPGQPGVQADTYDFTDAWDKVNVTLGADFGEWTIIGYVENLFDDDSITYVHPERFIESRYGTNIPRTIGIRFSYGI